MSSISLTDIYIYAIIIRMRLIVAARLKTVQLGSGGLTWTLASNSSSSPA